MNWSPFVNILFVIILIRLLITTFIRPNSHIERFDQHPVSGIQFKVEDWKQVPSVPTVDGDTADLDRFIAAKKSAPGPFDPYANASNEGNPNVPEYITDPSAYFKINRPTEAPTIRTVQGPDQLVQGPGQLVTAPAYQTQSGPEWKYQNESVANGGKWGSLMGFDVTDNFYGEFGSSNDAFSCNLVDNCNDDMRNGMGIPQKDKIRLNL